MDEKDILVSWDLGIGKVRLQRGCTNTGDLLT
jgi:hypothetical protein